jgi:hypothetical protein
MVDVKESRQYRGKLIGLYEQHSSENPNLWLPIAITLAERLRSSSMIDKVNQEAYHVGAKEKAGEAWLDGLFVPCSTSADKTRAAFIRALS